MHHPTHDHPLDPNSLMFQVGRLLFPELINRGRAMRRRMILIGLIFCLGLTGTIAGVLWQEYSSKRATAQAFTTPLKPGK